MVFHVLNRSVGRRPLFTKDEDVLAFGRVIEESLRARPMRLYRPEHLGVATRMRLPTASSTKRGAREVLIAEHNPRNPASGTSTDAGHRGRLGNRQFTAHSHRDYPPQPGVQFSRNFNKGRFDNELDLPLDLTLFAVFAG